MRYSLGGLLPIVLGDVANQDIGIEADHPPAQSPPLAMASSISSSDTGRFGFGNIPLSRRKGAMSSANVR